MVLKHKQMWEQQEITGIKTSNEYHFYWKKHFQRTPLYFRFYADFEADN